MYFKHEVLTEVEKLLDGWDKYEIIVVKNLNNKLKKIMIVPVKKVNIDATKRRVSI